MYIKRIIILVKYGEIQYLLLIYYSIFRQKRKQVPIFKNKNT